MSSLNRVMLIGNIGKDPEVRYTQAGQAVTNISIATTERYKDKQTGQQKEVTEWHRVVFFNRLAEIAGEYLRKGAVCFVEGQMRTRKYTDGNGIDKYTTEIVGSTMKILGGKNGNSSTSQTGNNAPYQTVNHSGQAESDEFDDQIPF